jgi:hypothetical protein
VVWVELATKGRKLGLKCIVITNEEGMKVKI